MKLNEIQEEWKNDSIIDDIDVDKSSMNVPKLHAKYLYELSNYKLKLIKHESEYLRLRSLKSKYYRGQLDKETLKELEWDQYQGPKLLKTDLNDVIDGDEDIIKIRTKIEYINVAISTLEAIMKSIYGRSFDIKNIIDYRKFNQGML